MLPKDIHNKKIVISALNWGLGHLMRCVPLIKELQDSNTIIVACDEEQKPFFEAELSKIQIEPLEAYPFRFSGKGNFGVDMARAFFVLHKSLRKERARLKLIVEKHRVDFVISDQRLGFYNKNTCNILISHQLNLPLPWYQKVFQLYCDFYVNQFDAIWVPDAAEKKNRITGKLTQTNRKNVYFIEFLSRFKKIKTAKKYAYGAIVSGPSPYNQQFLDLVVKKFNSLNQPCFIITSIAKDQQMGKTEVIKYTSTEQINTLLQQANCIVSRAGYSTIMDLKKLDLKAILIPTPGQYEQLYLGKLLEKDTQFITMSEEAYRSPHKKAPFNLKGAVH